MSKNSFHKDAQNVKFDFEVRSGLTFWLRCPNCHKRIHKPLSTREIHYDLDKEVACGCGTISRVMFDEYRQAYGVSNVEDIF
jgi:hypothetical protein